MDKKDSKLKTLYNIAGFCSFGLGSDAHEVDVMDGKIVRTRPLHYDNSYTKEEMNPWRLEARGKVFEPTNRTLLAPFAYGYKQRVTSPNRIKYPLKRVDWDPEGERNPQNRGKSKFVRISWDEATDLVAKELERVNKQYGPTSVLAMCEGHGETKIVHAPHGCQTRLLDLMGGYTQQARQTDSWEGWYWGAKHVWGQEPLGQCNQANLWKDVSENTEMLLFWGCDQETTPWGWGGLMPSRLTYWFAELGIQQIYISPDLNYAGAVHADKWIPIKPNTDAAMHLAIAYTWISEDGFDKDYVDTHVHGFEEFKNYVMGYEDGVPKTPVWAAEICGVPSRTIKALARRWAKKVTAIVHGNGGGLVRSPFSTEPARLEACLLGMQGLGKPGRTQLKMIEWEIFGMDETNPAPRSEVIPMLYAGYTGGATEATPSFIPKTLTPDAILSQEPVTWYSTVWCTSPRENQFVKYQFPIEGGSRIHMIWSDTACWTTCWNGGNRMIEAMRSPEIECVVLQHPWFENDCLFADLILPSNTRFENEDIGTDIMCGQYNLVVHMDRCVEPYYESKSDYEVVQEVAKKLDLFEEFTKGQSVKDLIKLSFDHSGIEGMVSYDKFMENGYFVVPTADGWENDIPGLRLFAEDPETFPLPTPTGKLEFYSTGLAEHFPDDIERGPVPKWIHGSERHQERTYLERGKKYPYLLMSNHPRWRVHANMDDIKWFREIPTCKVRGKDGYLYEPVWINPLDAQELGIQHGDIVKLHNERGGVLGGAYVTERIMPGVLYQDHGARLDPIVAGQLDRGGANNLICPGATTSQNAAGEVTNGYLVGLEKVDIDALKTQYPEAFQRQYDADSGLVFEAWIEGGKE
ncbi:trimethylamine-N-oxide reductase (cytochrome c) [Desulfitobacterium sp. LBE]|uniref:molybdopterin-dependent oxidoreductase n=1 Tax=Desulfitobacterium sp. LBE TaxID=884086 RepID=UPI00119C3B89|nr:molybdopterin-dependent oxidoreductase [Desulfitobacterium sp. LBE]TWH56919.1 trimethylamine-N-oxide reductase (cytochrome c) [Desulfitobacterium sp. LBE]